MKPLRAPNQLGQFLACYTKAAQPDYKGTLKGGRPWSLKRNTRTTRRSSAGA